MLETLQGMFGRDFMPHGQCFLWYPELLWLHVVADTLIALSYFAIPIALINFIRRQKHIPFRWMFQMFAAFIVACGVTHVFSIITMWEPVYGIEGSLKMTTGLISVLTAGCLIPLLPKAMALPSPTALAAANEHLRQEITDRHQAEIALRESEQRFQSLYNNSPVMLHSIDNQGILIDVNDYWLTMMGYRRAEVIGRPTIDFLSVASRDYALNIALPHFKTTGMIKDVPYEFVTRDGKILDVLLSAFSERDVQGKIIRSLAVLIDVTAQKAAEKQAHQRQIELEHISRIHTMGELATGLAHELNQPLTVISNNCDLAQELIADGPSHFSKLQQLLEQNSAQALRAGDIIRRLRALVQHDESRRAACDMNELIEQITHLLTHDAEHKHATIKLCLADISHPLWIDRVQIEQVLLNLIRNSLDAMTEANSFKREITITSALQGVDRLQVSVADTGPGLDPERSQKVFEPFVTNKAQGMGLGLSISRSIIEDHGGHLWTEPNPGGGAAFHFSLSLIAANEHE